MRRKVVLPAPSGPTKAVMAPAGTSRSSEASAVTVAFFPANVLPSARALTTIPSPGVR